MKMHIFSIRDAALQAYMPVWTAPARGVAHRMFSDEINSSSNMAKHPDDFELYHLGEFDDATATFNINPDGPQLIVRGTDLKNRG